MRSFRRRLHQACRSECASSWDTTKHKKVCEIIWHHTAKDFENENRVVISRHSRRTIITLTKYEIDRISELKQQTLKRWSSWLIQIIKSTQITIPRIISTTQQLQFQISIPRRRRNLQIWLIVTNNRVDGPIQILWQRILLLFRMMLLLHKNVPWRLPNSVHLNEPLSRLQPWAFRPQQICRDIFRRKNNHSRWCSIHLRWRRPLLLQMDQWFIQEKSKWSKCARSRRLLGL